MSNYDGQINRFKDVIKYCNENPDILEKPPMEFLKAIQTTTIPVFYSSETDTDKTEGKSTDPETKPEEIVSDPESDVELDMEGVIEGDSEISQPMGDPSKVPTEEEMDEANDIRSKAAAAYSEQKFQESIDLYTKAIEMNPGNALYHAKRGQAYLKLQKPNACIKDCIKALEINCDSAAAYKFRGRAHRLLGNWESAAKDLRQACKLDFDEEADEWLKEVTPNAKKLEQHKLKQERKKTEKELKNPKQAKPAATTSAPDFDINNFLKFMDPEVTEAFSDVIKNPMNFVKYANNKKVMDVMTELIASGQLGKGAPSNLPKSSPKPPPKSSPKPPPTDFTDDGWMD